MNYELALELKKAGFPQGKIIANISTWIGESGKVSHSEIREDTNDVYSPTLGELIEACTNNNYNFELSSGIRVGEESFVWTAKTRGLSANGYSTLEAVARLYLALNKK